MDRAPLPTAAGDWHETELAALRQEHDALRAWLAGLARGEVAGSSSLVAGCNQEPGTLNQELSP